MPSVSVRFNDEPIMDVDLIKEVYVVGRVEGCDIHIDNLGISRNHARFLQDGSGYAVEDMNSSNGTFVNGQRISRIVLNDGDEIVMGKYILTYSLVSQVATAPATPSEPKVASVDISGGDSLNTMTMDGEAIRKRIEEMKRHKDTIMRKREDEPAAAVSSTPANVAEAEAEAKVREAELRQMQKNMLLMKVLIFFILLAAVAVGVYAYVAKKDRGVSPPGSRGEIAPVSNSTSANSTKDAGRDTP